MDASSEGIEKLLSLMGYSILQKKDRLLDADTLFRQKDLRERVRGSQKFFSVQGKWRHPVSGQAFEREAAMVHVEVADENTLKSRWPFEMTRYATKFGFPASQVLFFFTALSLFFDQCPKRNSCT